MQPGMGIMDNFTVKPHHFLPRQPPFSRKKTQNFHGCSVPKTSLYGCNLALCQFKFNISSMSRFMKPRMEIIDGFLLQPHNFFSKKSPFGKKMDSFCGCFCLKHVCVLLQTRIILFQCKYWLIRNIHAAWDGHHG